MGKKKAASSSASGSAFKAGAASKMQPKPNLFDLKVNKTKFNVLNKNVVGSKGNPTKSKARSVQIREKTLLSELGRRGRTGEFIDRRFGERNPSLSSEEKMLERFSRERMRTSKKKSVYNLNDEDDDYSHTLTLTHRGRDINELDAFDSEPEGSDADSDGGLDSHIVGSGHFGGPGDSDSKRTKAEIMQEVITKSKMHKHERQRVKDENTALCDDLDADFHSLLGVLEPRDAFRERSKPDDDDYNEAVKSMAFEKRSKPSDRTKTEEELEKEKEEKRSKSADAQRKRMYSDLDPDLDDENDDSVNSEAEKSIRRVMKQAETFFDSIMNDLDGKSANASYLKLAELCKTNSVIPAARVARERIKLITDSISRQTEQSFAPKMPGKDSLLLFHIIGRIFSTSDYHHVVVTPAQLLICAYLGHGRIIKPKHLLSALFLMQTAIFYQKDSKRIVPEMFGLLAPLLAQCFGSKSTTTTWNHYSAERFMSKAVHDLLAEGMATEPVPKAIAFDDLRKVFDDESCLTKTMVASFLLQILKDTIDLYEDNVAAPEILLPILHSLEDYSTSQPFIKSALEAIKAKQASRKSLIFQKSKPIPIPSLVPDLDDGPSREEREQNMLKRQYKREMKGAKKELKKDSAFLAHQKLKMRLESDRKYQERQRQILGSISNETASHRDKRTKR